MVNAYTIVFAAFILTASALGGRRAAAFARDRLHFVLPGNHSFTIGRVTR